MTSKPTPDWPRARAAWEAGGSNREVGRLIGVSRETVRKRAADEGWQRRDAAVAAAAEERRRNAEAATQAARLKWAERRAEEADAAGITAAVARQQIVTALRSNDPAMTKAAAVAYGVLIDKAQLLAGEATSRHEHVTTDAVDAEIARLEAELAAAAHGPS